MGVDSSSLAYNFLQLQAKVRSLAQKLQSDALIEEYLPGREFSVGILKNSRGDHYVAMPLELIAPPNEAGARFLSSQIKQADAERHAPVTDHILKAAISALALQVFHELGARDYGRIDIRLDELGRPAFLEANLLPSLLKGYGNFPRACQLNMGLAHESMVLRILELATMRNELAAEPATLPDLASALLV